LKVVLDKIELNVSKRLFGKVNVQFNEDIISFNDSKARAINIIKENYDRIKTHYITNLSKKEQWLIDYDDLNIISVKILFYYLTQYARWKEQYTKSNYDIKFYEKDFSHPSTYDIIIFFLKNKYPYEWKNISQKYINKTPEEFDFYWTNRLAYFNM
jgi:hypothetical protein